MNCNQLYSIMLAPVLNNFTIPSSFPGCCCFRSFQSSFEINLKRLEICSKSVIHHSNEHQYSLVQSSIEQKNEPVTVWIIIILIIFKQKCQKLSGSSFWSGRINCLSLFSVIVNLIFWGFGLLVKQTTNLKTLLGSGKLNFEYYREYYRILLTISVKSISLDATKSYTLDL